MEVILYDLFPLQGTGFIWWHRFDEHFLAPFEISFLSVEIATVID